LGHGSEGEDSSALLKTWQKKKKCYNLFWRAEAGGLSGKKLKLQVGSIPIRIFTFGWKCLSPCASLARLLAFALFKRINFE
jgi:hypothetical protein